MLLMGTALVPLRTDAARGDGSRWLVRCNEHHQVAPAASGRQGDELASKAQRQTWCKGSKAAARKAAKAA